jgi:microcystin-dependent protein
MQPFVGQLLLGAWGFAPKSFALCNGQLVSIQQNAALFSLLGTYYGGNGVQTFALPNLQGRTPISQGTDQGGNAYAMGQISGSEGETLIIQQVPPHTHSLYAGGASSGDKPAGTLFGSGGTAAFAALAGSAAMNPATVAAYGGSQPHENRQPYLVLNWCIALYGIFPSRN